MHLFFHTYRIFKLQTVLSFSFSFSFCLISTPAMTYA